MLLARVRSMSDHPPAATEPPLADVPAQVAHRHAELVLLITDAQFRYYVLDQPTLSDREFDTLLRELQRIEDRTPSLRTPESPTQRVGGGFATGFAAVEHAERLLSLDNVFSAEELADWMSRTVRDAHGEVRWLTELKIDGLEIGRAHV